MSTYVVPQTLVFQDFNLISQPQVQNLCAHYAGGHAQLVRHGQSDEVELGRLLTAIDDYGVYDPYNAQAYAWPQLSTGARIDPDYTKLFIDNALLRYFRGDISSVYNYGGTTATQIYAVAGTRNRVKTALLNLADNGSYPHTSGTLANPALFDRGVQLGDVVRLEATVSNTAHELWTYVAGLVPNAVASVIGAATEDARNAGHSGPLSLVQGPAVFTTPHLRNQLYIAAVNASGYNGAATGNLTETYTVRVVKSSTGGVLSTALVDIISASGNDNVYGVSPRNAGIATDLGTRGATITFNDQLHSAAYSLSAKDEDIPYEDLVAGQTWTVPVGQAWTKPTVTANAGSGTYTGAVSCNYIVQVLRGGVWAKGETPVITVTTDQGSDMSGAVSVSASGVAVTIGSQQVTLTWAGSGLSAGDVYYVPVTAASTAAVQTLVLGHNFPQALLDEMAANPATSYQVGLELFIPTTSLQIAKESILTTSHATSTAIYNWQQAGVGGYTDTATIQVNPNIQAYDATWTLAGVVQPLPVISYGPSGKGRLYVEYRAWESTLCAGIGALSDPGQLNSLVSGPLDPDNPLKWALYKGSQNNNGQNIYFTSVCNPADPDSWADVLNLLEQSNQAYGLVPLTRDPAVLGLWQAHSDAMSVPEMGLWRVCWFSAQAVREEAIVSGETSSDGNTVTAAVSVYNATYTPSTEYTCFTVSQPVVGGVALPTNAQFANPLNPVRPGDIVRYLFKTDPFGNVTYDEFVVAEVINNDTLLTLTGPLTPPSQAVKIEVWRNLDSNAQAEAIGRQATAWSDRRVRMVWPDQIGDGGTIMEGYHLCAALAALTGGVVPQQGLTRLAIKGFDDVSHTTNWFGKTQLNTMAGEGMWIVTQSAAGEVYTRHAVTTGPTNDINQREEMVTRNVDSISYYFYQALDPYIGVSNVTPSLMALLRAEVKAAIMFLKSNSYLKLVGPQLIDAVITDLRPHAVLKDRVVIALSLTVPYALNNIECHLVI